MGAKYKTNHERMLELIEQLTKADIAYYRDDNPIMSDRDYDILMDELKDIESRTGLVLSGSPTQKVSGEILEGLTEVRHTKPMLSADKTKSVEDLIKFASGQPVLLSWKMDGLTLVLRYENGELVQAITRGREGIIGEDVTHTVRNFLNVPLAIPTKDSFEVRGEGVISWTNFERINSGLEEPYTHPRNLASGSTRKLDAGEAKKRLLEFWAFELVSDYLEPESKLAQQQFLAHNGFSVVPYIYLDAIHDEAMVRDAISAMDPKKFPYPVDGIIMEYDDVAYGKGLGATGHHENRLIALKWEDELYETTFIGIPFEAAILDINIINMHEELYNITLHFSGGVTMSAKRCQLDLFNRDCHESVSLFDDKGRNLVMAEFMPSECVYDTERHATILPADCITLNYTDYYGTSTREETKRLVPEYLSIVRATECNIHYLTA